jgi:chromate transporter
MLLHDLSPAILLTQLAGFFLVTGSLTFGGGLAVVPLLQKQLVQGGWLSAADFLTAIAVGMVTPGPVMTAATFAGYVLFGPLGAVVCTIAIYLPSFLLVLFAAPLLMRHRTKHWVQGFVKGIYAAALGALLASVIVLGSRAIGDWLTAAIASIGLMALLCFRVSGVALVVAAAVIGSIAAALAQGG